MTIRITKQMASDAAGKMAHEAYDKKIHEVQEEINKEAELIVKKYIPAPVIACTNEYPTYISYNEAASITTTKPGMDGQGYYTREMYIHADLSFKVPTVCNCILVNRDDYDVLRKLFDKKVALNQEQSEFRGKIEDALVALHTYKKVQEELPEAVKYLDIPSTGMVPACVYKKLNDLIAEKLNNN